MPDNRVLKIDADALDRYFTKDESHQKLGQLYAILVKSFADDFVNLTKDLVGILPSQQVLIPPTLGSSLREESISVAEAAKIKLAKLIEWENHNSTHAKVLKQRRDFNAKQFARTIRRIIVLEALQSLAHTQGLQTAFNELYQRLYPAHFSCAWPIRDADELLSETADMLIDLLLTKVGDKTSASTDTTRKLDIYLRKVSTAWPPLVQRVVVTLIVAAVIFSLMAALQIASLNINPLMAFQLVNVTASSAPQIWAIATPVAAILVSLAAACLPKYSSVKTNRLSDMHREAQLFKSASVNPLAGKGAGAGSRAAASMCNPMLAAAAAHS